MRVDILIIITLAFSCSLIVHTETCSCMRKHPQEHYCQSDFVILARVKRQQVLNTTKMYKVRLKKSFKISEKGILALKSGRLLTPTEQSMCASELEIGKLYILSGNIFSLRAYINLCNMAIEWREVTKRQRKGLRMMYRHGCSCQIKMCRGKCYRQRDSCNWNSECQTKESICLRHSNLSCLWSGNNAMARCAKEERYKKSQKEVL